MENNQAERNTSPTRYATIQEAKTVVQTFLSLNEEQFELEDVKPSKIK